MRGNLVKNSIKATFGLSQHGFPVDPDGLGTRAVGGRTNAGRLEVSARDADGRREALVRDTRACAQGVCTACGEAVRAVQAMRTGATQCGQYVRVG